MVKLKKKDKIPVNVSLGTGNITDSAEFKLRAASGLRCNSSLVKLTDSVTMAETTKLLVEHIHIEYSSLVHLQC